MHDLPDSFPTLAQQERLLSTWLPCWNRKGKSMRERIARAHDELFAILVGLDRPQCVFEIGAHEAGFSTLMAKALPETGVFAFEANPEVFEEYSQRITAAGVRYQNLAILDRDGENKFAFSHCFATQNFIP